MANVLGGIDYDAELSSTDYTTYRNLIESEILKRFLLSVGTPPGQTGLTGIVDFEDPSQISTADVSRPLLIRISDLNQLHIQVNPGVAVTPNGAVIEFAGDSDFQLARTQAGDINVVFVENELIPAGTRPVNDYQEELWTQEVQNPEVLRSVLISDFNNPSTFTTARKKNIVVLGVCTVVPTGQSSVELQIDMGKSVYGFTRPWFSIRDTQHRSQVGSGQVTQQNPHGISINDLTVAGDVGLFQGLSDTGLVVSRDRQVNKMAGSNFCTEVIPLSRIKTDQFGTVTEKSPYGGIGAKYIELLTFPTRLGSIYETNTPANQIAGEIIPTTNILVFAPFEQISKELSVQYTEARAVVPPVQTPGNLLVFGQPGDQEVIVSSGLTIDQLPEPSIDMDGTGPYPRTYEIYLLSDRSLAVFPQILIPSTRLTALGSSLYTPPRQMMAPARIGVGLTKVTNVSGMELSVEISGVDTLGAQIVETVTISNQNGYADETIPSTNYDSDKQIYRTQNVFSSVQTVQVISRQNDGPLGEIQVWAEAEAGTASNLNDITLIARVGWNGQGVQRIRDGRVVSKGFYKPDYFQMETLGSTALDAARLVSNLTNPALIMGNSLHLVTEDFEDLKYFDTLKGFFDSVQPTGRITIGNNSLIQANDQIQIAPGKVLTATTIAADPTVGQFQIDPSVSQTIQNIINTVNDPDFNSGVMADFGNGQNIELTYTAQGGTAGNVIQITRSVQDPASIQVQGFSGGFDRYSECYLDRNVIGLRSKEIPSPSEIPAYGYRFRSRYRSRAIALPRGVGSYSNFCVVLHGQNRFHGTSVRIRGSSQDTPAQWLEWQIMQEASPGVGQVYLAEFPENCHKVQVEIFGEVRGFSLFSITPNP